MKKTMIVSSLKRGPFVVHKCSGSDGCGNVVVTDSDAKFCPMCASAFDTEGDSVRRDELTASLNTSKHEFMCASCGKHFTVAGTDKSASDLENTIFCTSCGSPEVEELDSNEDVEEMDSEDVVEDVESSDCVEGDAEMDDAAEERVEETESDVQDSLEAEDGVDQLQLVSMTLSDGDEVVLGCDKNAQPIFRFRKSKLPESAHPIFATSAFYQLLHQRAKDVGLFSAVKDFNGEFYKPAKVVQKADLEAMSIKYMQDTMLPRFMDCIATAIEGTIKGMFPEAAQQLKASLFDELSARVGSSEECVANAVQATFASNGMSFFTAVVAKAVELMQKPEANYSEVKSMVQATAATTSISFASSEQVALRNRLENGNVPISIQEPTGVNRSALSASVANASVQSMRQALKLGHK